MTDLKVRRIKFELDDGHDLLADADDEVAHRVRGSLARVVPALKGSDQGRSLECGLYVDAEVVAHAENGGTRAPQLTSSTKQPIAVPAHGDDVAGTCRIGLDVAAQARDEGIDDARARLNGQAFNASGSAATLAAVR